MPTHRHNINFTAIIAGIIAILLWSGTMAIARSVIEAIGPIRTAAITSLIAGATSLTFLLIFRRPTFKAIFKSPPFYLLGCGTSFTLYILFMNFSLQYAANRQQVLEIAIINYLWPILTLLAGIIFLHHKPRLLLIPGVILAIIGIALATLQTTDWTPHQFIANLKTNHLPYLFALAAATVWAFYSVLARHFTNKIQQGAVPVFLLAAGITCALASPFDPTPINFQPHCIFEILFMSFASGLIAYTCWDFAMRKGPMTTIVTASYTIPLWSTLFSSLYLNVPITTTIYLAAFFLIIGSILSKLAVDDTPITHPPD